MWQVSHWTTTWEPFCLSSAQPRFRRSVRRSSSAILEALHTVAESEHTEHRVSSDRVSHCSLAFRARASDKAQTSGVARENSRAVVRVTAVDPFKRPDGWVYTSRMTRAATIRSTGIGRSRRRSSTQWQSSNVRRRIFVVPAYGSVCRKMIFVPSLLHWLSATTIPSVVSCRTFVASAFISVSSLE